MAGHILLMNVTAPLLALQIVECSRNRIGPLRRGDILIAASCFQIIMLWSMHTPPLMAILSSAGEHAVFQASLFGTALLFWCSVLSQNGARRWRALLALLVTGKFFCLLGVLLIFAPRALYTPYTDGHSGHALPPTLLDQQFAGLLMVAACPLSFVLAAVIIAARWLFDIDDVDVHALRPQHITDAVR
jgi:putative membrane protein